MVEDVLKGNPGDRPLPVVVYLDDIAVFGDDQDQVLADTLEAIRRLTEAGFMINLKKSQLVESAAKVLGHQWMPGGFWAPCTTKIEALQQATDSQLAGMNRASLYGLLNFFREYVANFAEMTEPLRELLGQDARPWTPAAGEAVRAVADRITGTPRWLNMDPTEELRMETRVCRTGITVLLLQRHPERKLTWLPVASWGHRLDVLEQQDSRVVLELRALHEGSWKLGEYTAYAPKLVMQISPELRALLKVSNKAHPELQALLIDLMQYRPKFLIGGKKVAPKELGMEDPPYYLPHVDPPPDDQVKAMAKAERAMRQPIHLPAKARFVLNQPAVHV